MTRRVLIIVENLPVPFDRRVWLEATTLAQAGCEVSVICPTAPGFEAPGVVVSYTDDAEIQSSRKFLAEGLQTAAGVPLQCDEGADFKTFRIGLFGLEKWQNVDRTVGHLAAALDKLGIAAPAGIAQAQAQAQPQPQAQPATV